MTIGTFSGLAYWNDWTNGLYYINKKTELFTIQNLLNRMVSDLQYLSQNSGNVSSDLAAEISKVPSTGVQMAIAFVAILPIILVFPSSRSTIPRALHWARLWDKKTEN